MVAITFKKLNIPFSMVVGQSALSAGSVILQIPCVAAQGRSGSTPELWVEYLLPKGIRLASSSIGRQKLKKCFELTANNFSLSGFDSRHGFKQQVKEIKTPAIAIDECFRFSSRYVQHYLFARYVSTLKERPAMR